MKNEIPIYAIDFEGSKKLGIVEFGIVGILNGNITGAETAICRPREKISQMEQNIFKISTEEAYAYPPFEDHSELFSELREKGIFAAHSFQTEDSLLRSHIPSPGQVKNFFTEKETLGWAPWIDSRTLAKSVLGVSDSAKLSDIISALALQNALDEFAARLCPRKRAKWHCALYDAIASAMIIATALPLIKNFEQLANICGETPRGETLF